MCRYQRPSFLLKTVERILRDQTYTNVEIIIVDDSDECLAPRHFEAITPEPDLLAKIKYHCLKNRRYTIGEKRNFAVEEARGSIIAFNDDDDMYAPNRLENQYTQLLAGDKDVVALYFSYILDIHEQPMTLYQMREPQRGGPHFGTLMFKRDLFEQGYSFPNTSFAEDYSFVERVLGHGARFAVVQQDWVYLKHDSTWREFNVKNIKQGLRRIDDKSTYPAWWTDGDTEFFAAMSELLRTYEGPSALEPDTQSSDDATNNVEQQQQQPAKKERPQEAAQTKNAARSIVNRQAAPNTLDARHSSIYGYGYGYTYGYGHGYGYSYTPGVGYAYA